MNSRNKALINYYARLVQKENKKIEDIPENLQEQVKEALAALPPLEPDPEDIKEEEHK